MTSACPSTPNRVQVHKRVFKFKSIALSSSTVADSAIPGQKRKAASGHTGRTVPTADDFFEKSFRQLASDVSRLIPSTKWKQMGMLDPDEVSLPEVRPWQALVPSTTGVTVKAEVTSEAEDDAEEDAVGRAVAAQHGQLLARLV